nr:hypothetical protein Iba_chr07bCG2260 [Ipomoea batatas]
MAVPLHTESNIAFVCPLAFGQTDLKMTAQVKTEVMRPTVFLSAAVTISPGLAVPDASTTSLVLPGEEGLKGAGPEDDPALSQGFGGEPPPAIKGESTSRKFVGSFDDFLYDDFVPLPVYRIHAEI